MERSLTLASLALGASCFFITPAAADLAGTTVDVTLAQVHPNWPYSLDFAHVYGTTSTVWDPLFPAFPIHLTTPGGAATQNSIVIDFTDNQYGDFTGFTGAITIENLAEDVDPASLALLNENGVAIGSISGSGDSFTGTWDVDDVLAAGTGTMLVVAWNSVAPAPTGPQPAMGAPLSGLTPAEQLRFELGLDAFQRPLLEGEGLGPVFNDFACAGCHNNPIGGTGTKNVTRFGLTDKGIFFSLDQFGGSLLQEQAIDDACLEDVPPEANTVANRITNGALGYGLVEAIPDADILALEQPGPGVSGRAHIVEALEAPGVPRVGRFGWKAQVPTILTFSADAALNEMGLTSRLLDTDNDPNGTRPPELADCDSVDDHEDGPHLGAGIDFIDRVTDFQRLLAPPPQTPRSGMTGEVVFNTAGCADCHHPGFVTADDGSLEAALRNHAIRPYSDFLLHDMGLAADFIAQGDAAPREVRTPPLWGVRVRDPIWHDGRIGGGTFDQRMRLAIAEHGLFGSEAVGAVAAWNTLAPAEQDAVVAFLDSLGRREFDADGDGLVDLTDFLDFRACLGAPFAPDDLCAVHDFDQDGDVDLDDAAVLVTVYDEPVDDCNDNGTPDLIDILDGTSSDADDNGVPDECIACAPDLDGDDTVGTSDLLILLSQWGPCAGCDADADGDDDVDVADLLALLSEWGDCP